MESNDRVQNLVSDVIARADEQSEFNAHQVLDAHPELRDHRSAVIDLAYEEYCHRLKRGEDVSADDFVKRFPSIQRSLLRLVGFHDVLENHPELLQQSDGILWPSLGEEFLRHELVAELGQGAFSRVFLARALDLGGRHVVLKVCRKGNQEAHMLGTLQHENVVLVHSVQEDPITELMAISMSFSTRATLFDVIDELFANGGLPRRGRELLTVVQEINAAESPAPPPGPERPIPRQYVDAVIQMARNICEALAYCHEKGVIHGDIKPSNILVTNAGVPVLIDFNLAVADAYSDTALAGGTLPYMAPEQLISLHQDGEFPASAGSPQSDLYSLGVTLYELLAGRHPFGPISQKSARDELVELLLERQRRGPRDIRSINPHIDGTAARLIESMLAFEPDSRPQSAAELSQSLSKLFTIRRKLWRWAKQRPTSASLATAGLGLALAIPFVADAPPRTPPQQPPAQILTPAEQDISELMELHARERFKEAVAKIETLPPKTQDRIRVRLVWAHSCACMAAEIKGRPQHLVAAIREYKSAIENGVQSPRISTELAWCAMRLGDWELAETEAVRAINANPTSGKPYAIAFAAVRRRLARVAAEELNNHASEALDLLRTGSDDFPDDVDLASEQAHFKATLAIRYRKLNPNESRKFAGESLEHCRRAVELGLPLDKVKMIVGSLRSVVGDEQIKPILHLAEKNPNLDPLRWLPSPFTPEVESWLANHEE